MVAIAAALACGDDGGGGSAADARPGADGPTSTSVLGTLCTPGVDDCPSGECVILESGSDTTGYCSPVCTNDGQCTDGYTGPGTPTCFVPDQPNRCTISCTDACPTGLECFVPMGAPMGFCRVPE